MKNEVESPLLFSLLTLFKEQVMLNPDITTSRLIGMEAPSLLLPFLNCSTNILVMLNFHTLPSLQLTYHLLSSVLKQHVISTCTKNISLFLPRENDVVDRVMLHAKKHHEDDEGRINHSFNSKRDLANNFNTTLIELDQNNRADQLWLIPK